MEEMEMDKKSLKNILEVKVSGAEWKQGSFFQGRNRKYDLDFELGTAESESRLERNPNRESRIYYVERFTVSVWDNNDKYVGMVHNVKTLESAKREIIKLFIKK
jgi:hypothetical protein